LLLPHPDHKRKSSIQQRSNGSCCNCSSEGSTREGSRSRQHTEGPLMSLPSIDELKGKLTEDELLKSEGHAQKLTGLVQERYAITRDEADKQVSAFFKKHD
jgi:uncharacterized protein YjbJ (UPF0337 family)